MIFAAIGLLIALAVGDRRLRLFSVAVASMMALILGLGLVVVKTDLWRLPSLIYYEMFIVPIFAIFAAYGVTTAFAYVYQLLGRFRPEMRVRGPILGAAMAFALLPPAFGFHAARKTYNPERVWGPYPPNATPLVTVLKEKIGLVPGGPFRGRVATFLLLNRNDSVGWLDLVDGNARRVETTGNDYFWSGLWPYRVPTLFEYIPLMSPSFFRATVRLLGRQGDRQMRNVIVLRRPDSRLLAFFGVRYIIADSLLPAPFRLELSEKTFGTETLYLYEVPNVNLGSYSPVETRQVRNFDAALDQLADSRLDPARTALLFEPLPEGYRGPLSPAEAVDFRLKKGKMVLEARSQGISMVVVPFEFSNCLTLESSDQSGISPKLIRVNAMQSGILFKDRLSASVGYFTSPFSGATCRIRDRKEFVQLLGSPS